MYVTLGAWDIPTNDQVQQAANFLRGSLGNPDYPLPWVISAFNQSKEGTSMDASSPNYGYAFVADNLGALSALGWWDAVADGMVPPTVEGVETYRFWWQQLSWGNAVPADFLEFVQTLPQRNSIYRTIAQIIAGVRAGTLPNSELNRVGILLHMIAAIRKMAYIQLKGMPPQLGNWIDLGFFNQITKGVTDTTTLKNVATAILGLSVIDYANQAGVPNPFPQLSVDILPTLIKVGLRYPAFMSDDGQLLNWADFLPDMNTVFTPQIIPTQFNPIAPGQMVDPGESGAGGQQSVPDQGTIEVVPVDHEPVIYPETNTPTSGGMTTTGLAVSPGAILGVTALVIASMGGKKRGNG